MRRQMVTTIYNNNNNYLRGGIGSMLKRSAREKDKGNSACALL